MRAGETSHRMQRVHSTCLRLRRWENQCTRFSFTIIIIIIIQVIITVRVADCGGQTALCCTVSSSSSSSVSSWWSSVCVDVDEALSLPPLTVSSSSSSSSSVYCVDVTVTSVLLGNDTASDMFKAFITSSINDAPKSRPTYRHRQTCILGVTVLKLLHLHRDHLQQTSITSLNWGHQSWTICRRAEDFYRATACNATHSIAVAILSVHLCIRRVYCDKTKWCSADILIPHEMAIILVFWHQHWLVGDAPFPLKYSPKVTHLHAKLIVPNNQYFIFIRQMALRSRYSCLANSSASRPAQNHWLCWQLHNRLFRCRQSHGLSAIAELLVLFSCDYSLEALTNELLSSLFIY